MVILMILEKIVYATRLRVENAKQKVSLQELKSQSRINSRPFSFEKALKQKDISFICEVKKASPSKGVLSMDFPFLEIAREYEEAGAAAISVLTEPDFFKGSVEYLRQIKAQVSIPVLQKDFIVDEYQIHEASAIGADAILLICSVLSVAKMREFIKLADSLGISCLVEAHTEREVLMALEAGARIIGINNRNLSTFTIDIQNSITLRKFVPDSVLFVSESGIGTSEDIAKLREVGADAVLIGETLMKSKDIKSELANLRGEKSSGSIQAKHSDASVTNDGSHCDAIPHSRYKSNNSVNSSASHVLDKCRSTNLSSAFAPTKIKICGIKSFKDIGYVNEAMPDFIGFVFAKGKRHVDFNRAYLLKAELDKRIKAVGVFVNEDVDFIKKCCTVGVIDIIQLHGDEDEEYIRQLKISISKPIIKAFRVKSTPANKTNPNSEILKSQSVDLASPNENTALTNDFANSENIDNEADSQKPNSLLFPSKLSDLIDFPLFDTFSESAYGGTGESFNWELVRNYEKPFFLAGGLNIDNIEKAISVAAPFCVDISSGVETNGIKDRQKINDIVKMVRKM
jgi:indole-3-glycerol phosphate synthase/phosphoribosylanthranilate isomerase